MRSLIYLLYILIPEYLEENIELCVQAMQHLLLLFNNRKRCQLQLLINFMKKTSENSLLQLSSDLTNKELVSRIIYLLIDLLID